MDTYFTDTLKKAVYCGEYSWMEKAYLEKRAKK